MFKVNNKDTKLWTYFTPFSNVFIVNFKPAVAGWVAANDSNLHYFKFNYFLQLKRYWNSGGQAGAINESNGRLNNLKIIMLV